MPKTTKKVSAKSKAVKKVSKKTVKKVVSAKVASTPQVKTAFSQEFTDALLVIFGAGMMLFAYVIFKLYG